MNPRKSEHGLASALQPVHGVLYGVYVRSTQESGTVHRAWAA